MLRTLSLIGLLLAGTVYWACTVLVLHFHAFGEEMAAAAQLSEAMATLKGNPTLMKKTLQSLGVL